MEDNLGFETTLDGRQPWMEDDLGWKMTIDRRQTVDSKLQLPAPATAG